MTDPTPKTTPTCDEAVPPGWKLVPTKPTLEMQKAYFDEIDRNMSRVETDCTFGRFDNHRVAYAKMLSAAPAPASGVDAVERLEDKIEGLEADLASAVEVAFRRGAAEWTRLNYPALYARLNAASLSPAATPVSEAGGEAATEAWRKWNDTYDPSKDMMFEGAAQRGFLAGWAAANIFRDNGERK